MFVFLISGDKNVVLKGEARVWPLSGYLVLRCIGEEWRARSDDTLDVGDAVKVVAVQGNTLNVARA